MQSMVAVISLGIKYIDMRKITFLLTIIGLISVVSVYAQSITQRTLTSTGQSLSNSGISLNFTVGELSINHLKSSIVSVETGLFGKTEEEGITLPATLVDFSLASGTSMVKLYWTVTQEYNTAYYELLKSTDAITFYSVGRVTALGNASIQRQYAFTDLAFYKKSYYQLKIVDMDGRYKLSNILSANPFESKVRANIFPNPVRSFVNINIKATAVETASIYVRSAAGTVVITKTHTLAIGQNVISLNLVSLPIGSYFITVQTKDLNIIEPVLKL
jgi:hypothetical protein